VRPASALTLPLLLAAQTAVLQIRVVEGEGAVRAAGSRVTAPLTVMVTDEIGKPVEGVAVSFRLPDEGPGGTFANGMKTEVAVTGANGRATTTAIHWNHIPGPLRIRITAVKGQARAGMVVSQYLSGDAPRRGGGARLSRSKNRWLAVTAVVASAAAAGFTVGWTKNSKPGQGAASGPVRVGPPAISIGKP